MANDAPQLKEKIANSQASFIDCCTQSKQPARGFFYAGVLVIERGLECGERFNTANAFRQGKDVLYHNYFVNVLCGSPARIARSSAPENGTAATKLYYTMANSLKDVSSLACFTACDRGSAE